MSRGEASPISFLWLHPRAGASLKVWDPGYKAEDLPPLVSFQGLRGQ